MPDDRQPVDSRREPGPTRAADSDEVLRELLEICYARIEDGEAIDLDEICRPAPALRPRLERLIERHTEVVERVRRAVPRTLERPKERLGDFDVIEPIGVGGMGEVYRAVQISLGREVALKILKSGTSNAAAARRFRREAEIAATLDHPNVVPVYATGEDGDRAWISMKLLTGPNLAALPEPLDPKAVAALGAQVARGLHAAHLEGVVHRDIKPGNVVLDHGRPVLVDFGLARSLDRVGLTTGDAVPGTLSYMPPEQLSGARAVEPRSDVYSLCATLYECVAGRPPFVASTIESLVRVIVEVDPAPLDLPWKDRDLDTILRRGLRKEPSNRFTTALELAEDLERFAGGETIRSRRAGMVERSAAIARRHPKSAAIVGILAILLIVVATRASVLSRERAAEDRRTLDHALSAADAGRLALAGELIDDLERRAPGIDGLRSARRHIEALEAVENLLDEVQSKAFGSDSVELRRALAAVESTGATSLRRPLTDIARAAALLQLRERERAGALLSEVEREFGRSRATAALLAGDALAADTGLGELRALGASFDAADDAVFSALAFRIAGRPVDEQRAEIEAGLVIDAARYRTHYALAVAYHDSGDYGAAYAAWLGLETEGRHRPNVLRNLAVEAMICGKFDLARAHLAAVPERSSRLRATRDGLDLCRLQGRREEYRVELQRAAGLWPDDSWLTLRLGLTHLEDGRPAEATACLRRVASMQAPPAEKHAAGLGLLLLEMKEEGLDDCGEKMNLDADGRDAAEALRVRARAAVESAPDKFCRSDARLMVSYLDTALGDDESARAQLELALSDDSGNPAALVRFLTRLGARCLAAARDDRPATATTGSKVQRAEIDRGRTMIDSLVSERRAGPRSPTPAQISTALEMGLFLALADGGLDALAAAERRLRDHLTTVPADIESKIEKIREHLSQPR